LQCDIAAIVDNDGNKVVEYKYNAWGKPIGTPWTLTTAYGTLAMLNPFRYRGYVWDQETMMFYLRSRYYSPAWGRFVSRDSIFQMAILVSNMYAYCNNNPIVKADDSGNAGYCLYFNVYDPIDWKGKINGNGHYDITIISSDPNASVKYNWRGDSFEKDRLIFSYGRNKRKGAVRVLDEERAEKHTSYLLIEDITQDQLQNFIDWLSTDFLDERIGERLFGVKDKDFMVYNLDKAIYCGSAAAKFILQLMPKKIESKKDCCLIGLVVGLTIRTEKVSQNIHVFLKSAFQYQIV
jgi:RHS repeat-associated protein